MVIDGGAWFVPPMGIVTNVLLAFGCHGLATRFVSGPRGLFTILGACVLFGSLTILGIELLGKIGAIAPLPLLAFSLAIFVAGRLARTRARPYADETAAASDVHTSAVSWDARICVGLLWTSVIYLGVRSLLMGVKVVSDGPIYHLYFAVRWWKAGRLFLVAAPFGENAATYFPANGDLWFTWLLTSWGSERLAKVGQAPFLMVALGAVWACTRTLRIDRSSSLVAICCFGISTPLLLFSFEPNVDTVFTAGYLAATAFFLRTVRGEGGTGELMLGSLAAGAALGTKAVGVVFLPPLFFWVATRLIARPIRRSKIVLELILLFLVPLVTCGYWFIQNTWLTGNPLYPLNVEVWGMTLLRGWYGPDAMRFSPFFLEVTHWKSLVDILMAVLDPRLVPFWLSGLVLGWSVQKREPTAMRGAIAAFSILAVINVAFYWLFIPYRTQQRFMLQALGLASIPLARLLSTRAWLRMSASLAVALHVLTPQPWPWSAARESDIPWDLDPLIPNLFASAIPFLSRLPLPGSPGGPAVSWIGAFSMLALVTSSCLAAWSWFADSKSSAARFRRVVLPIILTVGSLAIGWGDFLAFSYDSRLTFYYPFRDFYLGWTHFDGRCGPRGARVAYAGTNIPYYLLGNGLRNDVEYINVDGHRDWLLHDYHRAAVAQGEGLWPNPRPGWDRTHPSYEEWLANLIDNQTQLLVVTHVNPNEGAHNVADRDGFPIERQWAESHPDRFEPVYGVGEQDPQFRIYRILKPAKGL